MMTKSKWLLLAGLFIATNAWAEGGLTLEERVERLERKGELPQKECCDMSDIQKRLDQIEAHIKNLPFGIKLGGGISTLYQYDLNDPAGHNGVVSLRGFDKDHNTFTADLFQLQVSRAPGEDGVGFLTKVNFGKTAERMAADWNGDGTIGGTAEEDNSVELQDAWVSYNPPGLPDLQIKAGKFVTPLGAEVIEPWANPNISRSLAFTFAIPLTHVGATASYAFGSQASVMLGIVNGWDNVVDSNDGKTAIASVGITPVEQFSLAINGLYGCEQPNNGDSKRGVADIVATIKPIDNLAFILNYDYGNETDLHVGGNEEWNAFSGIVAYDLVDALPVPIGLALRGEFFDDRNGTRLPTPGNAGFGDYQNAWEVTTTFKVVLAEGLMFRTEYRYDAAKNSLFAKRLTGQDDTQNDQHTIAANLTYTF